MTQERILDTDVALVRAGWHDEAELLIEQNRTIENGIVTGAVLLANRVSAEKLRLPDLRRGTSWACAADGEASRIFGGDLTKGTMHPEDKIEAWARRIAHHAGKRALYVLDPSTLMIRYQRRTANQFIDMYGTITEEEERNEPEKTTAS